ncbi:MAG: hypothetical protein ACYC64_12795 [Armatimonadota bacterium]
MGPGPEPLHLAGVFAKSIEIDRSPGVTQRASDITQEQIAGEEAAALSQRKADAMEQLRRDRIRQERERRRRELERHTYASSDDAADSEDGDSHLDVVA